jgi:RNA polymerase sigma-70 factor (ECF subfamily)
MLPSTKDAVGHDAAEARLVESWSDEEVVRQVLDGHLAAFELIMRRYNQRLFRIVRGMVGDDDEAEDVLQEAYFNAFKHLQQFAGQAKFSTWLTKIAIYEALGRQRRRKRVQVVDWTAPENTPLVPLMDHQRAEHEASVKELGHVLTKAVDGLPDDLRIVFVMRLVEGLDIKETAACLELTAANVKVRVHRARALLRQRIDEQIGAGVRQLYQFGGGRCDRIVRAVLSRLTNARLP